MNHTLWRATGSRVIAMMFIVAGLAACGDRISDTHARTPDATPPSPSAVLVGTAPAQPTGDPPGTTPVADATTTLPKEEETGRMRTEGQNHAYSSVSPDNPQKAQGIDPQQMPGRKKDD
jgi:hypothetical protein